MNKRRKLSPLDILFNLGSVFKAFIPALIIFYTRLVDLFKEYTLLASLGLALLLLLIVGLSFLSWKNFVYWFEKDRLIIRKGIFQKDEKTIYYQRIHSVNIQQPLLKRIFNVAQLQIETPGGKKGKSEGELSALPLPVALQLQQQLQYFSAIIKEKGSISADSFTEDGIYMFEDEKELHNATDRIEGDASLPMLAQEMESSVQAVTVDQVFKREKESGTLTDTAARESNDNSNVNENSGERAYSNSWARQFDTQTKLSIAELLKASLTSLNFGIAIAFIVGIFSFADDFINLFNPSFSMDQLWDNQAAAASIWLASIILTCIIIAFVWLLSIALYILKFANYEITRSKAQIMIAYGLLDKKSFIFDQKKVQAVIIEENIVRQMLGFAELKVQVITADQNQEQLIVHPFIKKSEIESFIEQYLPHRKVDTQVKLQPAPIRSYRFYVLVPFIVSLAICGAAYFAWSLAGLWALMILPIVGLWSLIRLKDAGVWLENNELILRNRWISRVTYYVVRSQIVTLQTRRSPGQRKKKVRSIGVRVLGSTFSYRVKALEETIVLQIWQWYSKDKRVNISGNYSDEVQVSDR